MIYITVDVHVKHVPNADEARMYSRDELVEKIPVSSVHKTIGCLELYKSAAIKTVVCYTLGSRGEL